MKIKTDKLTGAALDWAVAKCEGIGLGPRGFVVYYHEGEPGMWQPSTDWAQGGPIIDREKMTLAWGEEEQDWFACIGDSRKFDDDIPDGLTKLTALTPLIAAMRCYVASKLGDEVDVPEELV